MITTKEHVIETETLGTIVEKDIATLAVNEDAPTANLKEMAIKQPLTNDTNVIMTTWSCLPSIVISKIFEDFLYLPKYWKTISKDIYQCTRHLFQKQARTLSKIRTLMHVISLMGGDQSYTLAECGISLFRNIGTDVFDKGVIGEHLEMDKYGLFYEPESQRENKRLDNPGNRIIHKCGRTVHLTSQNMKDFVQWILVTDHDRDRLHMIVSLLMFQEVDIHFACSRSLFDTFDEGVMNLVTHRGRKSMLWLAVSFFICSDRRILPKHHNPDDIKKVERHIDNLYDILNYIDSKDPVLPEPHDLIDPSMYANLAFIYSNESMVKKCIGTKLDTLNLNTLVTFTKEDIFEKYCEDSKIDYTNFQIPDAHVVIWRGITNGWLLAIKRQKVNDFYSERNRRAMSLSYSNIKKMAKRRFGLSSGDVYIEPISKPSITKLQKYYDLLTKKLLKIRIAPNIDWIFSSLYEKRKCYHVLIYLGCYYDNHTEGIKLFTNPYNDINFRVDMARADLKKILTDHPEYTKMMLKGRSIVKILEWVKEYTACNQLWELMAHLCKYLLFHPRVSPNFKEEFKENFEVFKNLLCKLPVDLETVIYRPTMVSGYVKISLFITCIGKLRNYMVENYKQIADEDIVGYMQEILNKCIDLEKKIKEESNGTIKIYKKSSIATDLMRIYICDIDKMVRYMVTNGSINRPIEKQKSNKRKISDLSDVEDKSECKKTKTKDQKE